MATRTSLYHAAEPTQILAPVNLTGNGNSTNTNEVDMQGYEGCMFIVNVGLSADTLSGSLYMDLIVEHSDTSGSGFADAADEDIINPVSGATTALFATIDDPAEDETLYFTAYRGTKRFLRVEIDRTGNHSSGCPVSVTAIRFKANVGPTN